MEVREVRKRAVILAGTDRGLCGSLKASLFRLASQFDRQTAFIAAGKRAAQFVARTGRELLAEFTITDSPRFAEARPIASFARDLFLNGEVDQVQIVGTRFINTMVQQAVAVEFLPVGEIRECSIQGSQESEANRMMILRTSYLNPNPEAVLSYLLGHYLNIFHLSGFCWKPKPASRVPEWSR